MLHTKKQTSEKCCDLCNRQTDMVIVGNISHHNKTICDICAFEITKKVKEKLEVIPF